MNHRLLRVQKPCHCCYRIAGGPFSSSHSPAAQRNFCNGRLCTWFDNYEHIFDIFKASNECLFLEHRSKEHLNQITKKCHNTGVGFLPNVHSFTCHLIPATHATVRWTGESCSNEFLWIGRMLSRYYPFDLRDNAHVDDTWEHCHLNWPNRCSAYECAYSFHFLSSQNTLLYKSPWPFVFEISNTVENLNH